MAVPLQAPIRHSNGAHWGRFVRTTVEAETDTGLIGLGEMGGGGESAEAAFDGPMPYLVGHDPFELEALWFKICDPTASLYNNSNQLHAAIEFACLDIVGKALEIPVYDLPGGKVPESTSAFVIGRRGLGFAGHVRIPASPTVRTDVGRRGTRGWRSVLLQWLPGAWRRGGGRRFSNRPGSPRADSVGSTIAGPA